MVATSQRGLMCLGCLLAAIALGACVVDEVTFQPGASGETCTDGIQNGGETSVDCGGGGCAPCGLGSTCALDRDCASGGRCDATVCQASASCAEIHQRHPALGDGVYLIAPNTGRVPIPPFDVVCDMTRDGGGWALLLKADGERILSY